MQKKIKIKILVLISLFTVCESVQKKHVIGTRGAGFFSNFLAVLNHIAWCERHDKIPVVYWDRESSYYNPNKYPGIKNVWEYYFEPVASLHYTDGDRIHRRYGAPDGTTVITGKGDFTAHFLPEVRQEMFQLIQKYIHIKQRILAKVDSFYEAHMQGRPTVGVHIRRTDNYVSIHVALEEYLKRIQEFPLYQVLVCTDDMYALEYMKDALGDRVIYCDVQRSHNNKPLHHRSKYAKGLLGEEVLMEVLLLARCDSFIHAISNVVCGVLYFNPTMPHIFIDPRDYGALSL
ncbi:MAG: nodulation protein NodZ [Candidatus Babeliales bacterium]